MLHGKCKLFSICFHFVFKKSLCKGNFWAQGNYLEGEAMRTELWVSLSWKKGVIPWHGWEQLYPDAAHFLQARRDVDIHTRTQIPLFHNMNSDALFSTWPKKKGLNRKHSKVDLFSAVPLPFFCLFSRWITFPACDFQTQPELTCRGKWWRTAKYKITSLKNSQYPGW